MKRFPFLLLTLFGLTTCTARDSTVGPVTEELTPSFATVAYDCAAQSEIPPVECEILVSLYNKTNGPGWSDNSGWFTSPPCSWYGVRCHAVPGGIIFDRLALGDNQLTGTIPPELGTLTNLVWLNLRGNQLTGPIPPELGNLTNLRDLTLNANDLTGTVPATLGNLEDLAFLRLDGNRLTGLVPLGVAVIGGRIDDSYFVGGGAPFCQLAGAPPGVYMADTPEYRAADLDGDGRICGIAVGGAVPTPPPSIADAILVISNRVDGLGDGSDGNTSYFVELQHLLVEGDVSGLEPDDVNLSVNGSGLSVAWPHFEVAPEGGNTRVIVWSPLDAPPPLGEYSVTVRDQYGQTSDPFVITDLEDLPRDAPDILLPEHLSTITNPQPTFQWQPFKSQYLGQQLDTEAYGLQLIPSSGQSFGVWPMPADQTSLRFENDGWTPSQPPDLAPGAHAVNVSAFRAISGRLHFEHTRWIDFVVAEPSCATQNEIPIQECEALVALYNSTNGPGWTNHEGWLDFSHPCTWHGVTCFGVEARSVVSIDLPENKLSGVIPAELGDLAALTFLRLNGNELTGAIPPEIGNLTNLNRLELAFNKLTGSVPPELGDLTDLTYISLCCNELSGPIPVEIGKLAELELLHLQVNSLSGPIPPELGGLSSLQNLHLNQNQLTGGIPAELGNLTNLTDLYLLGNPLGGSIPGELGNLTNLRVLDLRTDQLAGDIPSELWGLNALEGLGLSGNQLTGSLPPEIGNLKNLKSAFLTENLLAGSIPPELGTLENLEILYLGYNSLTGPIPSELGNLSNLRILGLSQNQLSGPIPPDLGNLSNLIYLFLDDNQLSGPIPSELGNLSNLFIIRLYENNLSGLLPLPVAQLGGLLQEAHPGRCQLVPPGNEDLYIPDTEAYRAADLSGLGAICGVPFTNNAETVTEDLTAEVEDLVTETVLNAGQAGALTSKLDNALAIVAGGQPTLGVSSLAVDAAGKVKDTNYKVAINLVNAFRNQVNDFVTTAVLTPEEAAPLLERASILIELWSNM